MSKRTQTMLYDPTPLYWYKEGWNQKIYSDGVELSLQKTSQTTFEVVTTVSPEDLFRKSDQLFQWCPILRVRKDKFRFPSFDGIGLRLFARSGCEEEPVAIVEALHDDSRNRYRLFACKEFQIGDAVFFFSIYEEETGNDALGGNHVRISDNMEESNVHITRNRMLRCTKPIKAGDEIVRWEKQEECVDVFEKIDRLVFSPEKELTGRIGQDGIGNGEAVTVHYCDGSTEVVSKSSGIGFGYRMQKRRSL